MTPTAREALARGIAFAVVVLGSPFFGTSQYHWMEWNHVTLALIGLLAVIILRNGETGNLRLMMTPIHGWRYWLRMGIFFGLLIGVAAVIVIPVLYFWGIVLPVPQVSKQHLLGYFLFLCVYAPLVEEVIYRSLLAAAIEPTLGFTGTILASGVIFAAAHVINGNPGPDNQIAGFLLMWAFLRSGTILVPLAMHAAGNTVAVLMHVVAYYWSNQA